ncbi:MAG TPA: biosynthetic peptidoglycan transglycosylase [Longimicrobium sp.]
MISQRYILTMLRYCTPARLACAAALGLAATCVLALWPPNVDKLARQNPGSTAYMRLGDAESATAGPARITRWTRLDRISPLLVCAVLKAEDRTFFRHGGFEWAQLRKAASRALSGGPVMGGSTITQQTARNVFLGPERSMRRKVKEAVIAKRLEQRLGKERILEIYLNTIEWGDGVWGVDAASRHYLGEPPSSSGAFEATFLASLIAAPRRSLHGGYGSRAERVQRRTLEQLYRSGLIGAAERWAATEQAGRLHDALRRGVSLRAALADARSGAPELHDDGMGAAIPAAHAVAEGCGLARELGE